MIDWNRVTREETVVIRRIVRRAMSVLSAAVEEDTPRDVEMDISAAHIVCPMDLDKLESADELNFAHDICGIRQHLNRDTGELMDCFTPRCSK